LIISLAKSFTAGSCERSSASLPARISYMSLRAALSTKAVAFIEPMVAAEVIPTGFAAMSPASRPILDCEVGAWAAADMATNEARPAISIVFFMRVSDQEANAAQLKILMDGLNYLRTGGQLL
jgi:hypothetical protein